MFVLTLGYRVLLLHSFLLDRQHWVLTMVGDLPFILGFDFLIQFYEGHLLVEARHNRCNNRILLNLLSFIPSNMLRKEKLVNEAKVVMP